MNPKSSQNPLQSVLQAGRSKNQMQDQAKYISPGDLDLVTVTDDVQEAINLILDYERRVGPPEMVARAFA